MLIQTVDHGPSLQFFTSDGEKKQARMKIMMQIPTLVLMMEKYVLQKFKKIKETYFFFLRRG